MVEEMEGERVVFCFFLAKGRQEGQSGGGPLLYASGVGNITVSLTFHACNYFSSQTHTHTQAAECLLYAHTLYVAKPLHVQVGQFVNGCGYFGTGAKPPVVL